MRSSRLAAVLLVAALVPGAAVGGDALDFETSAWSYLHNLEFTGAGAQLREGETFFGQQVTACGVQDVGGGLELRVGLLLDLVFGAESDDAWEAVEPYANLTFLTGGSGFRAGNLDQRDVDLLPALYFPVHRHVRPAERGLEAWSRGERTEVAGRLRWRALNTAAQRENFDVDLGAAYHTGGLRLDVQVHGVHSGGQLHDNGSVSDNWAAGAGGAWTAAADLGPVERWSIALHGFRSYDMPDRAIGDTARGSGLNAALAADVGGVTLRGSRWLGDAFLAADGHPLRRTDRLWTWGFDRDWALEGGAVVGLGFSGHHLEGDFEQEFWFTVDLPAP